MSLLGYIFAGASALVLVIFGSIYAAIMLEILLSRMLS